MKKIIISALNLFLLSSVLFGASLAYFSDTLVNEGNIITIGNLKVSLVAADDIATSGEGWNLGSTNLQDLKSVGGNLSPIFDFEGRVEPSQTLSRFIRVRNTGSIMMDYDLSFVVEEAFLEDFVSFSFQKVNLTDGSLGTTTTKLGNEFTGIAFSGTDLSAGVFEIYRVTIIIDSNLDNAFNFESLSNEAFDFNVLLEARQSLQREAD